MKSIDQAKRIYELCVAKAKSRRPVTYGEVLDSLGYESGVSGHAIRYGLELALIACGMEGLPKLTSIVVNQSTGRATPGTIGPGADIQAEVDKVFEQQEWPPVTRIDWGFVWQNRRELSDTHGTPGYFGK